MLDELPLDDQLSAVAEDPLRVLVVGAGVAGTTLSQLLRRDGLHPVLIDRAAPAAHPGYMLALMPMIDPVIDALGVRPAYRQASVLLDQFRFRSHRGIRLRQDSLDGLLDEFGEYRGIERAELLRVLAGDGGSVSHRTMVSAVLDGRRGATDGPAPADPPDRIANDTGGGAETQPVTVELDNPAGRRSVEFDLVVAADGIGSGVRRLVLTDDQVDGLDTGWAGWVGWIPADAESDVGEELWGDGFFLGSYPVAGRIGVFVGGPRSETAAGPAAFVAGIRRKLGHQRGRVAAALDTIAGADDPYYWSLRDTRASTWSVGRVVLLGDAAAGFLPTAGVGAGMAMESAWVLADRLRGVTGAGVRTAVVGYERAQRPRVEAAQRNSRSLARLMFRRSRFVAAIRSRLFGLITVDVALRPIRRLLQSGPAPARPQMSDRG